jgi:cell division protein FtsI/penicillin-binding protein 2
MTHERSHQKTAKSNGWRLRAIRYFFICLAGLITARLYLLQVVQAPYYQALSSDQHAFYQELVAQRGSIIVTDWMEPETEYFAATNEYRGLVYAVPRDITDPVKEAEVLAKILGYELPEPEPEPEEEVAATDAIPPEPREPTPYEILLARLSKGDDPYEPIERQVAPETLDRIKAANLPGIDFVLQPDRAYPESNFGGHLLGFLGRSEQNGFVGLYGLEGYFNEELSGKNGFLDVNADAAGRWIGLGSGALEPAVDGADIVLTIDRTIQYEACKVLARGVAQTQSNGGALVVIEPKTGRVIAMCSSPDFDPASYGEVDDISVYNNQAIFNAYEPGSVIKPLVMSKAIDLGVLSPTSGFEDTGEVQVDDYKIRNSDLKAHGWVTMTEVLESSLNTGMVYVERKIGTEAVRSIIDDYGFGILSGIELDTESSGTTEALNNSSEIYFATASYGQGFTVTPLQLASAYAAIANDGQLMKPYIVSEIRWPDGTVEKHTPTTLRQVISKKTATTVAAMMVSTLENGHGQKGRVPGYYIAGKTGTAQVAKANGRGYEQGVTKVTFAGFGPVEDPKFAMVVYLDHPRTSEWADATAAPVFGELAAFILKYFEVPPTRPIQ